MGTFPPHPRMGTVPPQASPACFSAAIRSGLARLLNGDCPRTGTVPGPRTGTVPGPALRLLNGACPRTGTVPDRHRLRPWGQSPFGDSPPSPRCPAYGCKRVGQHRVGLEGTVTFTRRRANDRTQPEKVTVPMPRRGGDCYFSAPRLGTITPARESNCPRAAPPAFRRRCGRAPRGLREADMPPACRLISLRSSRRPISIARRRP